MAYYQMPDMWLKKICLEDDRKVAADETESKMLANDDALTSRTRRSRTPVSGVRLADRVRLPKRW
jgi:hypothetical protein